MLERLVHAAQPRRQKQHVGAGDQLTLDQVPAREAILDPLLTGQKPIERSVELILISACDRELIRKRRQG